MLTNYKESCKGAVKEWVESTTKRKFDNLSFEDYKEFVVDYKVEVINTLGTTAEKSVEAGGGKSGELYHQESDFKKAIQEHLAKELSGENLKLLADEIQKGAYGKFTQTSTVKVANSILYEHCCKDCKGEGEIQCSECRGKGEFRCNNCAGKGEHGCDAWGCVNGFHYSYDGKKSVCSRCKGTGRTRCSRCEGAGYLSCKKCNSSGIITCPTCDGTSEVTQIAKICVTTTPKYTINYPENADDKIKQIIDEHITSNNADISNITRAELRADKGRVVEIYEIQMPFASFNLSFNDAKFHSEKIPCLVYGKNFQIAEGEDEILGIVKAKRNALILKVVLGVIGVLAVLGAVWYFLGNAEKSTPQRQSSVSTQRQTPPQPMTQSNKPSPSGVGSASVSDNFNVASSNSANSSVASENSNKTAAIGAAENTASASGGANADTAANESVNSSASAATTTPSIRLATKDEYVNLRKAPSGEVLTPIYKKDFDKITIKKLEGGDAKWLKVLYFPPNVSDESKAITGYIHISQIDKSSL